MANKLALIYGTGFGNTGIMAKAIEEGAKSAFLRKKDWKNAGSLGI